jgi:hypothetical protein
MQILKGHTSPETAYVVDDYPYGYTLRCKIRYWLEYKPKHGVRLVSQTTNPKRPGEVWNKPKASTYCTLAGAMFLDEQGHVHWNGIGQYDSGAQCKAFIETYGEGVPESAREMMHRFTNAKLAYDAKRGDDKTQDLTVGLAEARKAFVRPLD